MKNTLVVLIALLAAQSPAQSIHQQLVAVSKGGVLNSDMDIDATAEGSVIIAMPMQLTPGIKVLSVTDNAPGGGNTYKQVPNSTSSCGKLDMEIWYCEKCNPGVTELKFHLSGAPKASINSLIEVRGLALPAVLDGEGVHLDDATRTSKGEEAGPAIKTTAADFIVARYHSDSPLPSAVSPDPWHYRTSYAYVLNGPAGTYQPTLSGKGATGNFCMSMAAFKIAAGASAKSAPPSKPNRKK